MSFQYEVLKKIKIDIINIHGTKIIINYYALLILFSKLS